MEQAMKVDIKVIDGPWDRGWTLDRHTIRSEYLGENEYGRAQYDTLRTDVGEAVYQLKYKHDWSQVGPLAHLVATRIAPNIGRLDIIVPMPASNTRARQPVNEVAAEAGRMLGVPVFDGLLVKVPNGKSLKDIALKEDKVEAIGDSIQVVDLIQGHGRFNVLVLDDLFDTGATMEAACRQLRGYSKIGRIYVAALTRKRRW
jgi:predicted amidophosphoribosyltransferase